MRGVFAFGDSGFSGLFPTNGRQFACSKISSQWLFLRRETLVEPEAGIGPATYALRVYVMFHPGFIPNALHLRFRSLLGLLT